MGVEGVVVGVEEKREELRPLFLRHVIAFLGVKSRCLKLYSCSQPGTSARALALASHFLSFRVQKLLINLL